MNVLIGITGSIAAYKSAILARLFIKKGHQVKVIMTESAQSFISPLTLSTLSKNKVETDLFHEGTWSNHVELGLWADLFIVAPATATSISKMAHGLADNMLVATYLSAKCPVYIAPAMDLDMWKHPSTLHNLDLLRSYGNKIIPVEHGELASGLVGDGRMAEPEHIIDFLDDDLHIVSDLLSMKILVTAGPTYEDLDPVRFLGNNSTGRMGVEIADVAAERGAQVILVQGPGLIKAKSSNVKTIKVRTAAEMYEECIKHFNDCDAAILAAAVADYTPKEKSEIKIKKKEDDLKIELQRTRDIAAALGESKKPNQRLVGFALETNNAMENAKRKLIKKNLDFIVLNSLEDEGAGFEHHTNKVSFVFSDKHTKKFDLKSKKKVAADIIDQLKDLFKEGNR
ncbi:bifunctional phosphopantothenoylcysteine decarboxylase/phosphopantothenate--cysteine ligase CoaBC [Portibacter marinus]|uniref:bifunctional phosphopantothenoylcysteine decarboxylase/phosphopantothenate--cysteine ligase CoaBC n=1 Tax=Portibacter marinus TaxID=2898660 RepID=UPI001F2A1F50|nr:bifunctional phosphopantothenoylcysteine decarboxylase/phosphopantothenate--cysteine ligase CoaBC [Portibacter marinus]